ncbi:MAG: cysteine--tRNA ligase [Streptococcaceae bacterium]|nr:cysteine--tRNA ligase [Streptococcaceae bacterium]
MIKIYNTLSRQKEVFNPIEAGKVRMYVCGPTVYNYIHIGNARSVIAFDTIRRYLIYRGYEVNYVSNFTDVDDKIIRVANETNQSALEVANQFIEAFKTDTCALNILPATKNPRVIEFIPQIIDFIQVLIDKEFAYVAGGDVYFRAKKSSDYAKLAGKSIEMLEIGAGGRVGEEITLKEDPIDFALWKAAKAGEPSWQSPWGDGRPGWHIECSVMSTSLLGETIDIHGGGQDLEFPHHTNEIAQSEAKTGKKFVNYWMHNGFVTVGETNEKMSKSLGNFVTAHELIAQIDPQIIRFLMSTTQYRKPIQFSESGLSEAKSNLDKIKNTLEMIDFKLSSTSLSNTDEQAENLSKLAQFKESFITAMDDDFNAANGLTVIYELVKWVNIYLEATPDTDVLKQVRSLLIELLDIFGISFTTELIDHEIEQLITERNQARQNKNFNRADEIRDFLKAQGIELLDTKDGTRFKRGTQ